MRPRHTLAAVLLAASTALGSVAPAHADSTAYYRVSGNSYTDITLTLCSPHVLIDVNGNGRSDLDFELYTADGTLIYTDADATDSMSYEVDKVNGCRAYTLRVINRGYRLNDFRVDLDVI